MHTGVIIECWTASAVVKAGGMAMVLLLCTTATVTIGKQQQGANVMQLCYSTLFDTLHKVLWRFQRQGCPVRDTLNNFNRRSHVVTSDIDASNRVTSYNRPAPCSAY